jgi:hypothetical protein
VESIRFDNDALGENLTNAPIEPTEPVSANTGTAPAAANAPYTGNSGYAPNPAGAGPAGAGSPPPKPPRRGGLPGWAWALIGGGALLLIAFLVVIVIVINSVLGAVSASSRTDDSTAVPAPVATETAPADDSAAPTTKPTDVAGGGSGTVTSLDVQADLGSPFWSFPILDGWEIGVFDQEGVNQATNAELGCLFTTSQNRQSPVNADATDDRTDTVETLEFLTEQMVNSVDEAEVVGELGSTEVAIGMRDSAEALEFATSRVEYINPDDGGPYVNEVAMRAMPLSEAYLYLVVSCPAEVVDAGDSPFEEMLGEAAVIFE